MVQPQTKLDLNPNSRIWKYATSYNSKYYDDDFLRKLNYIANKRNVSAQAMLEVYLTESGNLSPKARNSLDYSGIGQIAAATVRANGYTVDQHVNFTPLKQLDLIDKHFDGMPKVSKDRPIMTSGEYKRYWFIPDYWLRNVEVWGKRDVDPNGFYKWNDAFDWNKKGYFTKYDVEKVHRDQLEQRLAKYGPKETLSDQLKTPEIKDDNPKKLPKNSVGLMFGSSIPKHKLYNIETEDFIVGKDQESVDKMDFDLNDVSTKWFNLMNNFDRIQKGEES